jgi:hypothetical protein
VIVVAVTPQLPFTSVLGFQTMPVHFNPIIALIIFAYVAAAEATKVLFDRKIATCNYRGAPGRNIWPAKRNGRLAAFSAKK